ncbi:hypothetical protein FOZ63_018366 [Perkinsus olseni]|uniref:Uncharacterized protein n=1 Tax=Perkinsus olseni TaxID=32597 RepID=A0A7J6TKB6_PEROL|nr:hypothetical protein FOZ63_018366 [Perkinsus olseni]
MSSFLHHQVRLLLRGRRLMSTTTTSSIGSKMMSGRGGSGGMMMLRYDSLLWQCTIAAAIWFVPQDIAAVSAFLLYGRSKSRTINQPVYVDNVDAAANEYFQRKGLDPSKMMMVRKSSKVTEVKYSDMYK